MRFQSTPLAGLRVIEPEAIEDSRGYFARIWCDEELKAHGVGTRLSQCSLSFNRQKGTLRGMHYQRAPHEEAKLVRCERGAIYDVALDIRPTSETFGQWFGIELSEANMRMLYLPEGFAHGFQTLVEDTRVHYQISEPYAPNAGAGIRYNDPELAIDWPLPAVSVELGTLSEKDTRWPDFQEFVQSEQAPIEPQGVEQ